MGARRAWAAAVGTVVISLCGCAPLPDAPWEVLDPEYPSGQLPEPGDAVPPHPGAGGGVPTGPMAPLPWKPSAVPACPGAGTPKPLPADRPLGSLLEVSAPGPLSGTVWAGTQLTIDDPGYQGPCGEGSIHLLDVTGARRPQAVVGSVCTGPAAVLHGRFALWTGWSTDGAPSCEAHWELVPLLPQVGPPKGLSGLPFPGPHGVPRPHDHWIEGPEPLAFLVSEDPSGVWVSAIDLDRAALRWERALPGRLTSALADELGRLFVQTRSEGRTGVTFALGEGGATLWSHEGLPDAFLRAAHGGKVVLGQTLRDARTGASLGAISGEVRLTDSLQFETTGCGDGCLRVRALTRKEGRLLFEERVGVRSPEALLTVPTDRDTLLVFDMPRTHGGRNAQRLRALEVGPTGAAPLFELEPSPHGLDSAIVVDGHVLMTFSWQTSLGRRQRLAVQPVPGLRAAPFGWLYERGNASGTRAPAR